MAWIESHTVLLRHRKLIELSLSCQVKPIYMMGHLHALWHTVLEQQEDGDLSRWSNAMIAQAAAWDGNADEFVTRLREWGWLDGALIHDWIDYVGPYLTKKYSSGNPSILKDIWLKHGYKYGKGNGKFIKQKASRKRAESEQKASPNSTYPSFPNPSSPNPSSPNPSEPKKEKDKKEINSCGQVKILPTAAKSAAAWAAYATAYRGRYGTVPIRNRRTNALLYQLVERIGARHAPSVAEFYLSHSSPLYVRARHPANLLVRDCEGLHTQWVTGITATPSEMHAAEMRDDAREQIKRVEAMLEKGVV